MSNVHHDETEVDEFEVPMSIEQVKMLKEWYSYFDQTSQGFITWRDLKSLLGQIGFKRSPLQCQEMIRTYSAEDNGLLSFDDFLLMYAENCKHLTASGEIKAVFQAMDVKSTGFVSVPKLVRLLRATNPGITDEKVDELLLTGFPEHRHNVKGFRDEGQVSYGDFARFLYN